MPDSSDPDLSAAPSVPDRIDEMLGAAVRAPPELPRFGPGDELLGRFRIEKLIGVGGMGAVYLATDPTLERQVAVKLHHTGAGTARLHREAVAMARLAHPNVIAVFEVGEIAGQAFVVMEYVAGATLRVWLGSAPRTPREILAMLLGAGAGLAAAHDAGLVHRDFKPENVLVADGRPRVGDFGLARGSQSAGDEVTQPELGATDSLATPLTRTGAVLGTPAYMAPEQFSGGTVDARADQFAFCVVAWELLYGERPFAGTAVASVVAAGPRKSPRRGSIAIRRVLERGLAADPAARHADMHELIAALRRRPRRPLVLGGVGVLAAGALAIALIPRGGAPSCDDAGAEVATAMPHGLPERIRAAGGPLAIDGSARIAAAISGFSTKYRSVAQQACRSLRVDPDLYRRSQACLTIRLRTAASLLAIEQTSAADVADVIQTAVHLPQLEGCLDAATLAASPALPANPGQLEAVVEARAALDAASDQLSLGRAVEARAAAARIAAGAVATEPTVASRLAMVRAQIATADDHVIPAEKLYREAYFAGRAVDDVDLTLRAVGALMLSTGELREDAAAAEEWIRNGLSDAERAKSRSPLEAADVYTIAARLRTLQDQPDEGARLAQIAVDLSGATPTLILAEALAALGEARCTAGKYDACRQLQDRALAIARELLGPRHPHIGQMLADMALDLSDGSHPEGLAFATEAKSIIDESSEASSLDTATTEVALASLIINSAVEAQYASARSMLEDARRRKVAMLGATHPDIAQIDNDLALLDNEDHKQAQSVVRLRSALAIQEAALGPTSTQVADTLYNLAATLRDANRYAEALVAARRAIPINAAHRAGATQHALSVVMAAGIENLLGQGDLAYADAMHALTLPAAKGPEIARGWALLEAGRAIVRKDPAHARTLLQESHTIFVALADSGLLAEVDALLAHLPR